MKWHIAPFNSHWEPTKLLPAPQWRRRRQDFFMLAVLAVLILAVV